MANTSASWDAGAFDPSQTFDNLLIVVAGYVPQHALETTGKPEAGADWKAGSLVHVDTVESQTVRGRTVKSLVVKAGCGDNQMPLWARGGAEDFDTKADFGNAISRVASLLPGSGGLELETTEFDASETYEPNTYLQPSTGDDAGQVKPSETNYNDNIIVGQVSQGIVEGSYGQAMLRFWTLVIPKVETT